jgi:hypothetical protein
MFVRVYLRFVLISYSIDIVSLYDAILKDSCWDFSQTIHGHVNYCRSEIQKVTQNEYETDEIRCVQCTIDDVDIISNPNCSKSHLCVGLEFDDQIKFEKFFSHNRDRIIDSYLKSRAYKDLYLGITI